MPLPLPPLAGLALKYGTMALAGYALARATSHGRLDQRLEDIMDATPEGATLRTDDGQANATFRWRRAFRMNTTGRGLSVDAIALTRLKVKRL